MLSPIDEIKSRLDIVEVIGSYIKLQKCGQNFRALCPFHSEKKPSFFVSPSRQMWHCFGCGKGGSIFNFVMEIEGVEFGDALRILAKRAGVELKPMRPELKTERQRLYEICELSCKFFEKQLTESGAGKEVQKYLLSRKISPESIKNWRIGYAPDSWQGLSAFLTSRGYQREETEGAGLSLKDEKGNFYDRFRSRIIFPLFDLNSQVIGFGGRIFADRPARRQDEIAKYMNIPNTLLYDKSHFLYGLDRARVDIRKKDCAILVEGYTDVILVSQAGFKNVVATSGTALTPGQLNILKRYSDNLLTAFDMDVAGDTATKRGIDLALSQGFEIKVLMMPKEKDPADIISDNPKEFENLINKARSIFDFYFESVFSRFDPKAVEGKKEISKILLPRIKQIPNKIIMAHWVQELSRRIEIPEKNIEEEMKRYKPPTTFRNVPSPDYLQGESKSGGGPKTRKEMLEEKLTSLILEYPQNLDCLEEKDITDFSPKIQKILSSFKKDPKFDFKKTEPELKNFLDYLYLKAEVEEEENPKEEILICLQELRSLRVKNGLDEIAKEIKKAEEAKDFKKVRDLIEKFNKLAAQLTNNQK